MTYLCLGVLYYHSIHPPNHPKLGPPSPLWDNVFMASITRLKKGKPSTTTTKFSQSLDPPPLVGQCPNFDVFLWLPRIFAPEAILDYLYQFVIFQVCHSSAILVQYFVLVVLRSLQIFVLSNFVLLITCASYI